MRRMYFISAHAPTMEQVRDAEKMGYSLVAVKSPILDKYSDVERLWESLLRERIDWLPGDAFVVMGEPRWVAWIVAKQAFARASHKGYRGPKTTIPSAITPSEEVLNQLRRDCGHFYCDDNIHIAADYVALFTTFTKREVIEEKQSDGTIKKTSVFKHGGFVPLISGGETDGH